MAVAPAVAVSAANQTAGGCNFRLLPDLSTPIAHSAKKTQKLQL
jgi:hypothetical protein